MFSVTIAGDVSEGVARVRRALAAGRFRVEDLTERLASPRRRPIDGLVVVTMAPGLPISLVHHARREEDLRFVPLALVGPSIDERSARGHGARKTITLGVPDAELVAAVRRMILDAQTAAAMVHQLDGSIADLSISLLVDTLVRARRDCVVRVRAGEQRGELRIRNGLLTSCSLDALTGRGALEALGALQIGRFRVEFRTVDDTDELGALDAETAARIIAAVKPSLAQPPPPAPTLDDRSALDASAVGVRVALAVAMINAVIARGRRWLPEAVVLREVELARVAAQVGAPQLGHFRVAPNGNVLVEGLRTLSLEGGAPIASWVAIALERLEAMRPGQFGRCRIDDVLGGLGRLVDQLGFRPAIDAAARGTTSAAASSR